MDFSELWTILKDWMVSNPDASMVSVLAFAVFYLAEKGIKLSPASWDDILIDGAKWTLRRVGVMKPLTLALLVISAGVMFACAPASTSGTGLSQNYTWPAACYADNSTEVCADAIIPKVVTDPAATSLVLRLANTAAITKGLYSAEDALAVISAVEAFADSAASYSNLAAYVVSRVGAANDAAGVAVFVTLVDEFASYSTPISACDLAIIRAHLARQRTVVLALGGLNG